MIDKDYIKVQMRKLIELEVACGFSDRETIEDNAVMNFSDNHTDRETNVWLIDTAIG